jgi:hypothetical protein
MEEFQIGWQYFLCGNHTRNLPVDAFNRRYETHMKAKLGPALEAAKYRGGGGLHKDRTFWNSFHPEHM